MRWLVLGLVLLAPTRAQAQDRPPECAGLPPEPAWLAAGPVYRDCEVDKPAKLTSREPRLNEKHFKELEPHFACKEIVLEFVVGADGLIEMAATRLISSDHQALTLAARETLSELRFEAATFNRATVRQLVVYRRGVTRGGGGEVIRIGPIRPAGGISEPAPARTVTALRPLRSCQK